ncbi:hypothetical protein T12_1811 [Trichinella patagoniensis]|uniref:Uncharacterized protein n=1 Tax=Trichinella patagoniensis TaxID=990121 RepID=A0A0V0ZMM7_9BILA|nr:hypothetical protein T12_1811 [Trichinella patagoniensis]
MTKLYQAWQTTALLEKSTPGSPQHPYTRTDAKGALKDNGNYSAKQYHQLLGTFYLPDDACNDYFWQTLLLATGEYPVEMPIWHLETLLLNVITLLSDFQRECAA